MTVAFISAIGHQKLVKTDQYAKMYPDSSLGGTQLVRYSLYFNVCSKFAASATSGLRLKLYLFKT